MKNSSKSFTNNMKNCRIYSSSHTYQRNKWFWKRFSCGNMLCQLTKSRRWNRTLHTTLFSTSACISLMAVLSRVNSSMAKLFKQMFLCLSHWRANIFFWNIYILKRIFLCVWDCPREVDYQIALNLQTLKQLWKERHQNGPMGVLFTSYYKMNSFLRSLLPTGVSISVWKFKPNFNI